MILFPRVELRVTEAELHKDITLKAELLNRNFMKTFPLDRSS